MESAVDTGVKGNRIELPPYQQFNWLQSGAEITGDMGEHMKA